VAREEIQRRQQREALQAAAGAWKDKDHPELKGLGRLVRKMRAESETGSANPAAPGSRLMAILLLDTTVIVDAINGKKQRHLLLDELLAHRNLLACCGINVTEVYAGMRPHEAALTEAFLRSLKFTR